MNTRNHQNARSQEWTLDRTLESISRKKGIKIVYRKQSGKTAIFALIGADPRHPTDVENGTLGQLDFLKAHVCEVFYVPHFKNLVPAKKRGYKKHA